MTNEEKELAEAAVSMYKVLKAQALSHRPRIDEELTDRPLLAAIKLLDAITTKLESKYGPWKN